MEETEEFEKYYPPKPVLEERAATNSLGATVFSLLLFVWAFFTFISDDLRFIAVILIVLTLHESGHFLAMKLFRYRNLKMIFLPLLGAYVHGKKDLYSQKERAIVLLSGPLPGILAGAALFYWGMQHESFWVLYSGILFLLINTLNLMPIDPLDGGQLMQVLFISRQDLVKLLFSLVSSLGMIFIGLYFDNWILIGFGFLLGFRVRGNQRLYQMRSKLKEQDINYRINYQDLSDRDYFYIKGIFVEHSPTVKKIMNTGAVDDEELDQLIASDICDVLEVPSKNDLSSVGKFVFASLWLLGILLTLAVFWIGANELNWFFDAFQTGR